MTDNVIPLAGGSDGLGSQIAPHLEEKARRLAEVDIELRHKARDLQRLERAFERAHVNLENRILERTRQLTEANARLREKARESARLEAVFGKVISNLEQRIEERAIELMRTTYAVGTKVVDGPGRACGIRLVGQE